MKFRRYLLAVIFAFFPLLIMAQYSGKIGDKIIITLNPETETRHPDLLMSSCRWRIVSGSSSAISLSGVQNKATVTILSYFSGSIKIACNYQIYKSGNLSAGYLNKVAYYDITCTSPNPNSGGGGSGGGGSSDEGSANTPGIAINATNFPDENFRNYLLEQDFGKDGDLAEEEIESITNMSVVGKNITSLKGIEYFTYLSYLWCGENPLISLDVSKNTALKELFCSKNQLTSLDLSKNTALTELYCSNNQLTSLDLSKNTALKSLGCNDNQLTSLDLSKNTVLKYLGCENNTLTSLDLSKNTALTELQCNNNQLTSLDLSKNTALTKLICDENQLTSLDLPKNAALIFLRCENNQLTSLDLSKNTALTYLRCENIQLTSLDLSKNTALTELYCSKNQLTSLDLSKNAALKYLGCSNNQLTSLDLSKNTALKNLGCSNNQLTSLDVSKNTALETLNCSSNQLISLDVSKNTALTNLSCDENQLTSLDVSKNTALEWLYCTNNQLTSLVSKNTALKYLYCYSNQLTSLDVSKNTALNRLRCYENKIKGANMDLLINSLPQNKTDDEREFAVICKSNNPENNVCTKSQVAAVIAKGWTPKYCYCYQFLAPYEGSEDTKGTELSDPFTPTEANAYGSSLGKNEKSERDYYIRGMVSSIKEAFGTQYGDATFYISADGIEKDQFFIYRVNYLGNTKYAGQDPNIRVGDDVIVCGKITNYLGTQPETMQHEAYVVSINGITTSISDIMIDANNQQPIYNLSGQKVSADYKGIVIINGKKVLRK